MICSVIYYNDNDNRILVVNILLFNKSSTVTIPYIFDIKPCIIIRYFQTALIVNSRLLIMHNRRQRSLPLLAEYWKDISRHDFEIANPFCGTNSSLKRSEKLQYLKYRQTCNMRCTSIGNRTVDYSDELHLHFRLNTWLQWIRQTQLPGETRNICFGIWCDLF